MFFYRLNLTVEELPDVGSEVPDVEGSVSSDAGDEADDAGVDNEIADLEENEGVEKQAIGQESAVQVNGLEYGPHQKLSR